MLPSPQEPPRNWPQLSQRTRELFRQGAQRVLELPEEWFEEMDKALVSNRGYMAGDPILSARARRHNRLNVIHWATANLKAPGAPVEPNIGPEMPNAARDLVRRGASESALDVYRMGQNWAWQRWMSIAFTLTSDQQELEDLLQASSRSITQYVDATIETISKQMAIEREEMLRGTQSEYREIVKLILNHSPINSQTASQRLGYRLDRVHTAVILWCEDEVPDSKKLDEAADLIIQASEAPRVLTIIPNSSTRWVWLPDWEPSLEEIKRQIAPLSNIRIALGTPGRNIEGFRCSHVRAVAAQRILANSPSNAQVVDYEAVRLISLVVPDISRIKSFLRDTLGDLLSAEPIILKSIYTFLESGCNISKSSQILGLHRNTLVRHLERAEMLLPKPLDSSRIKVAMALEILMWLPKKSTTTKEKDNW